MQGPPSSQKPNQDIQQLIQYYQMLEEQQKFFTDQLRSIDSQAQDVLKSKSTMEGLQGAKNGIVMLPIGSRALIKAKLVDEDKVLISVSKDVIITKTLAEGIQSMDNLLAEFKATREQVYAKLTENTEKLTKLRPEMERLYRASQAAPLR
ncbi:MAG: prefoldin subunit alpha [Promethearchaeota archaeon]